MAFPNGFTWGVASSSYQTEGGRAEGGRSASIWDVFSHCAGTIADGQNGDTATDGYHRFAEDIALMAQLGIRSYRFSAAWVRVDPLGDGHVNPDGLAYYDAVVDACRAAGIEPYLTLYHWDMPQALEDKGGWLCRDTADAFAFYAKTMAEHFRGRVRYYITLNEPQCSYALGYCTGEHAPGRRLPRADVFSALCNLLLAHGKASTAIRAADPDALVSIATTGRLCYPASDAPADIEAARTITIDTRTAALGAEKELWFSHELVLDPVCLGRFPACEGTFLAPLLQRVSPEDLAVMHAPPDFICLNIYNGHAVFAGADGHPTFVRKYAGFPRTAMKWPVTPEVLHWGVRYVAERYALPLVISENGQSCNDRIFLDGAVHDPDRIDFLHRYLRELQKACEGGADVRGYFHWCWTDNCEWASGYKERFGLVYVDYPSQKRILKDSARWYAEVIASNGACLA